MKPRISVIIPVYNAEKTIRRCVESLLFGKMRDIQVVLAEDCSEDGSWRICQELSREYPQIQCIRNDTNRGVSYTRNRALDVAQGEYVLFVDSDDWVSQNYAAHLVAAEQTIHANVLLLCGYYYINYKNGTKSKIIWEKRDDDCLSVEIHDLFLTAEKTLLQQLWNKIFRRDIIEKHHIRFDEEMSMGEDFLFVLDYLEAAEIQTCVVLNEPLYYYIRWGNSSLMSKFSPATREKALERFEKLRRICGEENVHIQAQYQRAVDNLRESYVYHTVRAKDLTKAQKLDTIRELTGENYRAVYKKQHRVAFKERTIEGRSYALNLLRRIRGRWHRERQKKIIGELRSRLTAEHISIISQNCIGGVFYHDMGLQFQSPTVNTFIKEPDFVKLCCNLRHYMDQPLQMRWEEEYPVGRMEDIEIHFMHYETCKEAQNAWERRKQRIHYEKILVLATDRNGFDDSVFEMWKNIPYSKMLYTVNMGYEKENGTVVYPQYAQQPFVPDLIPGREFYADGKLLEAVNEIGGKKR